MNAIILMLFMSFSGNEVANTNLEEVELINALNSEQMIFASIEEITTENIHVYDLESDKITKFELTDLIQNELSLDQTLEFEEADLMFEYQGDLFYLRG